MRFKVDESLHVEVADLLRVQGHEALTVFDQGLRGRYVYYDTEPMEDAKRAELLDFSKARLPIKLPKLEMKKISKSKAEKAK